MNGRDESMTADAPAELPLRVADVVCLSAPHAGFSIGIVASVNQDGSLSLYLYDVASRTIHLKPEGVPEVISVPAEAVCRYEPASKQERRRHERQNASGIIVLQVILDGRPGEFLLVHAELADISHSGAAFVVHRDLYPGQHVHLGFIDDSSSDGFVTHAVVRNVRQVEAGAWRVGCEFIGFTSEPFWPLRHLPRLSAEELLRVPWPWDKSEE